MLAEIIAFGTAYATPTAAVIAACIAAGAARRAQQGAKTVGAARKEAVADLAGAEALYVRALADLKAKELELAEERREREFFKDRMAEFAYEAKEQKRLCTECHDDLHAVTAELAQLKESVVGVRKLLERPDVLAVLMREKT